MALYIDLERIRKLSGDPHARFKQESSAHLFINL